MHTTTYKTGLAALVSAAFLALPACTQHAENSRPGHVEINSKATAYMAEQGPAYAEKVGVYFTGTSANNPWVALMDVPDYGCTFFSDGWQRAEGKQAGEIVAKLLDQNSRAHLVYNEGDNYEAIIVQNGETEFFQSRIVDNANDCVYSVAAIDDDRHVIPDFPTKKSDKRRSVGWPAPSNGSNEGSGPGGYGGGS